MNLPFLPPTRLHAWQRFSLISSINTIHRCNSNAPACCIELEGSAPSGSGDPGRIPTGTQKLPPVRGAIVWPAPPAAPFPARGTCTVYAKVSGASVAGMLSCNCQVPSAACTIADWVGNPCELYLGYIFCSLDMWPPVHTVIAGFVLAAMSR